jgi:aminopeptidase
VAAVDGRVAQYARLLVEGCLDVQPGKQVLVNATPLARPLYEEVLRAVARRGAYALPRLAFTYAGNMEWVKTAPPELLETVPSIEAHALQTADYLITIVAPENVRDGSDVPAERMATYQQARRPFMQRMLTNDLKWVGCQFPCAALAQEAGLTNEEFEEFLYGAVLIDWEALRSQMQRIADRFDAASEVRVVGDGTDLRFSLEGREGCVDALSANMPGGEVFYSPVEDSAEGEITFSEYPAVYLGHQLDRVRLRFEGGRVVDASAASDEAFLLSTLDVDEGARRLGEFGIGCNPGITKHMRNTLFDEKIEGTVHFAIGTGFPFVGGKNESAVHWDMVKDLRSGGRIEVDGETVQLDGNWLI